MRYRTVAVFLFALTATVVAPAALQRVGSLREEAGNRLSASIWNALLSLHGQKIAAPVRHKILPSVTPETASAAVSSEKLPAAGAAKPEAVSAKRRVKADAPAPALAPAPPEVHLVHKPAVELARLENLDKLLAVVGATEVRVVPQPPARPAASQGRAPRRQAEMAAEAVGLAKRYERLIEESVRHLDMNKKASKEAGKWAATERAAVRVSKGEDRRRGEYVFRLDPAVFNAPEALTYFIEGGDTH